MPESPNDCRQQLLEALRNFQEIDPFADLVARTEDNPEQMPGFDEDVYAKELKQLKLICEHFRLGVTPHTLQVDCPKSGVVVVFGARGAGKTTLLHRLRRDSRDALIIRPTHYRSDRPLPEYILHELVFELERRGQLGPGNLLDRVAKRLAWETINQRLRGFSEREWVLWVRRYRDQLVKKQTVSGQWWKWPIRWIANSWNDLRYHWGFFSTQITRLRSDLLKYIDGQQQNQTIDAVLANFPNHASLLQALAEHHVAQSERTVDLQGAVRAGLYKMFVQFAFAPMGTEQADVARLNLCNYLLDDYTKEYTGTILAPDIAVETLLRSLSSLLMFQSIPIVVAFDALDTNRMLGDPPKPERCQRFFGELADFLDNYPGIPFFLFAEGPNWQKVTSFRSQYAQQRIDQGIQEVESLGTIPFIELEPLDPSAVSRILRQRLSKVHRCLAQAVPHCADAIDHLFPFEEPSIHEQFSEGVTSLRPTLLALNDHYRKTLQPETDKPPDPDPATPRSPMPMIEAFEKGWTRIHEERKRELEAFSNLSTLADDLLAAFDSWMALAKTCQSDWNIEDMEVKSFGTTSYEQFHLCTQRHEGKQRTKAVGFLLGFGNGLSNDLKKKLHIITQAKDRFHAAILLWPTSRYQDRQEQAYENLPPGTRKEWDRNTRSLHVHLQLIPIEAVVKWLAIAEWMEQFDVESESKHGDESQAQVFCWSQTQDLMPFVSFPIVTK